MTMNFFKKVITFFSAIWNVILWRKTDRKAKQASKSKEEEQAEKYSTLTPETEKLFVDVPLHSSEAICLSEQELLVHDETSTALATTIAHTNESQPDDSYETKKYSSGVQIFGFEDEICESSSFFSEPIRDDQELQAPPILLKTERDVPESKENPTSVVGKVDLVAAVDKEQVNRGIHGETHTNTELSHPSGYNPEEVTYGEEGIPELLLTALEASPDAYNLTNSSSKKDRKITVLDDLVETEPLSECMKSSSDHLCVIPRSKINVDLSYLAIGEEIHLFDHDGITDIFSTGIEETETVERSQGVETDQYVQSESVKPRTSTSLETASGFVSEDDEIAKKVRSEVVPTIGSEHKFFETAESVFKDGEINQNLAASHDEGEPTGLRTKESSTLERAEGFSTDVKNNKMTSSSSFREVGLIGISVSSVQTTPGTCVNDCSSEYSTNYMVKSDSLVNFLPEGESGPDESALADITQVLLETNKTHRPNEEGKGIALLKEGCLEEVMCTPRGILKLSGDHRIDSNDENDRAIVDRKEAIVKTVVLMDNFSFEDNLLKTQHLEGCILEEPATECAITEDSPIFREIFRTVDSGLEDCETVEGSDEPCLDGIETGAIGRCITISQEDSKLSPFISDRSEKEGPNETPKIHSGKKKECRQTSCRLTQFRALHFDDEPECKERLGTNEFQISALPALRFGEGSTRSASDFVLVERERSSPHLDSGEQSNATKRFDVDSVNRAAFLDDNSGWSMTLPMPDSVEVTEIQDLNTTASLPFLNAPSSMLDIQGKSCNTQVDTLYHSPFGESTRMNDFYPFIDCSSFLFRIPEEIRKETTFNPCVGAAPSRRSEYQNNTFVESRRFDSNHDDGYEKKFQNMTAIVPKCLGTVPLINTCIPEEYKDSGATKQSDACDFKQRPDSQNVPTFWGAHPEDQHHALAGYPVSCTENYYEGEDLDGMPTEEYGNDQSNVCTDPMSYSYINPYGTVGFPVMNIPFCAPPQSPFMHRGPLPPIIFPISPISPTENLPSLMHSEAQNEQYSIPHRLWGGYTTAAHLQSDDGNEKDMAPMFEVTSLSPMENMSTGTNDDDDDFVSNPIPDYFHLADNNSLHTVKSKADSYTGSLFCESLRSIISHNTENESIFPSFSCSSVQGCCPSVLMQSCGTTLSNDSLPPIIVEETNHCSKGVDEDYLATEKFMNDVNTALNESVLDQIQGRVDLHSSLLGRGDGSMSMGTAQSENEDHETSENDVMLRDSLGENISINNSKLTLLDGVLRTESGGSLPNPISNLSTEVGDESSHSVNDYCRQLLNTVIETIFTTTSNAPGAELSVEIAPGTVAEYRGNLDAPHLQASPERNLIVQNMMFIEGMVPEGMRQMWNGALRDGNPHQHEYNVNVVAMEESIAPVKVFGADVHGDSNNSADKINDDAVTTAAEVFPNRVGRRNRKKRKKLSDVESENEVETCASGVTIGDGIKEPQEQLSESNSNKADIVHPGTSKPEEKHYDNESPQPKAGGEQFANVNNTVEFAVWKENIAQLDDEGELNQEEDEEPGENSGNPSNNRRRRHRRRKRKN